MSTTGAMEPVMQQQQVAYGTAPAQVVYQQPPAMTQCPPPASSVFDAIDRNHDGVITRAEFAQAIGQSGVQMAQPGVQMAQATAVQGVTYAAPTTTYQATPAMSYALPAAQTAQVQVMQQQVMQQQVMQPQTMVYAAPQVYEAPQAVTYAAPQVYEPQQAVTSQVYAAPAQQVTFATPPTTQMIYEQQPQQMVYYEQPQQQLTYVQQVTEPTQFAMQTGTGGMAYMTDMQQAQSFYQPVGVQQSVIQAQGQYQTNHSEAYQADSNLTQTEVKEIVLPEEAGTAISTKVVEEITVVKGKQTKTKKKLSRTQKKKHCC